MRGKTCNFLVFFCIRKADKFSLKYYQKLCVVESTFNNSKGLVVNCVKVPFLHTKVDFSKLIPGMNIPFHVLMLRRVKSLVNA